MILKHSKLLLLLLIFSSILEAKTVIEDGESGTTTLWRVVQGEADDISNVYDKEINSRVIELKGGGSYKIGATGGDRALTIIGEKSISWKMKTTLPYTIYVIVKTTDDLRYLFYVSTPSRGLKHGFQNGIHHGIGKSTIDGRWRRVTRDLEADLKDAEPNNSIISVNGFIYSGGNGGRLDDIILYSPKEIIYEDGSNEVKNWTILDNSSSDATVTNISDSKNQQNRVISLQGDGINSAYKLSINNSSCKILQWKFRGFGSEPEIFDTRGVIQDLKAFEFRVHIQSKNGARDLIYTLGEDNLGLIENGFTIHHGLGDDRAIGSVWSGDNPINELGLWQSVTRDLDEDIKDFEPNNTLVAVNSFEVRNSGLIDDVKMLSSVDTNISKCNNINSSNPKKESNSVGIGKLFLVFQFIYMLLILIFLLKKKKKIKKL
ncbi:MAG TPA: hypothetical protein ENK88_07520 [Campylobacterales bacterium]|nr:hypothetical protein [Campylobacterales bacterium]